MAQNNKLAPGVPESTQNPLIYTKIIIDAIYASVNIQSS